MTPEQQAELVPLWFWRSRQLSQMANNVGRTFFIMGAVWFVSYYLWGPIGHLQFVGLAMMVVCSVVQVIVSQPRPLGDSMTRPPGGRT